VQPLFTIHIDRIVSEIIAVLFSIIFMIVLTFRQ